MNVSRRRRLHDPRLGERDMLSDSREEGRRSEFGEHDGNHRLHLDPLPMVGRQ